MTSGPLNFEQALETSQDLLDQWSSGALPPGEFTRAIAELVATEPGARGFFVNYLTDGPENQNPELVLPALRQAPEVIVPLLVKNLAMSRAMAVIHRRQGDANQAAQSDRVCWRSQALLEALRLPLVSTHLQALFESATSGQGSYQDFLDRWGYDQGQRECIAHVCTRVLGHLSAS